MNTGIAMLAPYSEACCWLSTSFTHWYLQKIICFEI